MSRNFHNIVSFLESHDLKYDAIPDKSVILLNITGKQATYQMLIKVEDGRHVQVFGVSPISVPEGARSDIAVAIAAANYGLIIGKFELDMSDGEVRFHVALPFDGELPGHDVLSRVVLTPIAMLDKYMPAFLAVIYGNEVPAEAVACVEASGA
ncbi:YbjN domain-containing protein [Gimesia maris]|uniref:YbjN domain-containing protein n=1 Tax=Gimesia maris TaxID=122 RepID=A0ABX5YR54_9PLAN|nr:YbjN domain-containing protein [Gimesia maris]EDL59233.1 hypothetical protein PM8797T_23339 [Gimesia maris DSM 8797]QEG18226.1 hypothetical protein GmarT_41120 [Gimesia maris]QGQ28773.1 YbjN domain-containing protein [Gimesia maris]